MLPAFNKDTMDEDCDGPVLVIDLDDEREEKQSDDETCPVNYKTVTQHNKEDKTVRKSNRVSVTISSEIKNKDDDILVIEDDNDDYEHSVQKLIQVANKFGIEYRNNKPNEAESQHIRQSVNLERMRMNHNDKTQSLNPDTYHKERHQVNSRIIRDRILHHAKEDRSTHRTACKAGVCERRYDVNEIPYLVDKNTSKSFRADVAKRLEIAPYAERRVDQSKQDAMTIDEYHDAIKMFEYNRIHRPEVILSNDNYRDAATNMNVYDYTYRPEDVLSMDQYRRAIYRDTHRKKYRPEVALNMRDYRNDPMCNNNNNHSPARESLNNDSFNNATNRVLYDHPLKPEVALNNNGYRYADMNKDCSYVHRPTETLINDDCINRHAVINRIPLAYAYADALDDYWQNVMSRHAYRPEEVIDIDDYGRAVINRHAYATVYGPALSMDPYRTEPTYIDAYRELMLRRGAYYPETVGMYNYDPQVRHNNAYTNDEAILNLSRNHESTHVGINLSRDIERMNDNKLRAVLSTGTYIPVPIDKHIFNSENPDLHVNKHKTIYSSNVENRETIMDLNPSESVSFNVSKPAVPVQTNRLDTVILNTKNVSHYMIPNTQARRDVLTKTKSNNIAAKEAEYHEASLSSSKRDNVIHEEKRHEKMQSAVSVPDVTKVEKDKNVRFLVVFFSRVKELVKETFPEFSKSLEREIVNLGEVTNSGRMKTDIQFICPLYCSVSTYSLPRFDGVDDDNKIEKHINRTKICDVCSCIQNCYKLYKNKYFSLVSTANTGNEIKHGHKRKFSDTAIRGTRADRTQTVICKRKSNDTNENASTCDNDSEHNKDTRKLLKRSGADGNIQQDDPFRYKTAPKVTNNINDNHQLLKLNEKTLLDSLPVFNFNVPANNIDKHTLHNNINYEKLIEKSVISDKEKIVNDSVENPSYPRDEAEANLILSLSYNEITNADIISSKLKNKSGRKPDAVFTCHVCSCIFTYFTSFVSHMQKEHDINGIDEDIPDDCIARKCPFCGVYSKQKYHNDHVKRAHPQIFNHKGEPSEVQMLKDTKRKSMKRKFIFTCLVCHKNLKSREVKRHREKYHKGVKVAKMFTKKLSSY